MSKFITLEAAKQAICEVCERPGCPRLWGHVCNRMDRLDAIPVASVAPAIDVVEVVRCKDCAHFNHVNCQEERAGLCEHFDTYMYISDYCSDGYRRDDNG